MANDKDQKDINRNRPTEEGRDNDPNIRDESALKPGVSTISSSDTDDSDEDLSRTGADSFRTNDNDDPEADKRFDEVG